MEIPKLDFSISEKAIPPEVDRKWFREGWIAYESYVSAAENPQDSGTEEFYAWYRGWYEASQAAK